MSRHVKLLVPFYVDAEALVGVLMERAVLYGEVDFESMTRKSVMTATREHFAAYGSEQQVFRADGDADEFDERLKQARETVNRLWPKGLKP